MRRALLLLAVAAGAVLWTLLYGVLGVLTGNLTDSPLVAALLAVGLVAVVAAVTALAGRVRGAHAAHLPGSWLPHVVLATGRPAEAFARLHPVEPVRARITAVELHDSRTGETVALSAG